MSTNKVSAKENKKHMSEHTHHYTKENPPKVIRNEVSLPLTEATMGKTSNTPGAKFWTLEVTPLNQKEALAFIGDTIVNGVLTRFFRRVAVDIFTSPDNKTEDGKMDWDSVLESFAEFDTGGATLSDLSKQIEELQDAAAVYMEDPDYEVDENDQPRNPAKYVELTENIKEIMQKIRPLKKQRADIQKKYEAIAAKRKASKEAKNVATRTTA